MSESLEKSAKFNKDKEVMANNDDGFEEEFDDDFNLDGE